ncbi:hypothetical protein N8T08_008074 [Aspergillus melleus]|uniref:Uncharacterized protein n=1 Tax=Aspergillus melleus TaxID=138277 RepID=A0ACC3AWE7_9EURO|nr:hypothetical protein N8T08_008074 [Aspergillus melleus]
MAREVVFLSLTVVFDCQTSSRVSGQINSRSICYGEGRKFHSVLIYDGQYFTGEAFDRQAPIVQVVEYVSTMCVCIGSGIRMNGKEDTLNLISIPMQAQLSGSVGPKTSAADKASNKVCNVVDYGTKNDSSEGFASAPKEA